MTLWLWIVLSALVLAGAALVPTLVTRRRGDTEKQRFAARSGYAKLEHYVNPPVATDDEVAARSLRQAQERWHSAGQVLADASTAAEFELADQIATQGLAEVTDAYARLGRPTPE